MLEPQTSWLLTELMYIYCPNHDDEEGIFDSEIKTAKLPDEVGKHLNVYVFVHQPEIVFSRRIMHQMMQKPTRRRPSAHYIRVFRKAQHQIQQQYQEYMRTHS